MTEHEQQDDRDEVDDELPRVDPRDDETTGADDEPQPWAKALPGDEDG